MAANLRRVGTSAGLIAVVPHATAGTGFSVNTAIHPVILVAGYLAALIVLVVFGIWGFRLGSRSSGNDGRNGGPDGPEPEPPPGGREADEEWPLPPDRHERVLTRVP
jgi:hypothetical protein